MLPIDVSPHELEPRHQQGLVSLDGVILSFSTRV
jgi:hypothetical protein